MSVVFVVVSFVLICLVLVHINLHKKRKRLYEFIEKTFKILLIRHKKIEKLLNVAPETELTKEIKTLNNEIIEKYKTDNFLPSQRLKAEIIIEYKVKELINQLKSQEISTELSKAIDSYNKTQKKLDKNKKVYNELMQEFVDACNIKPALFYASFEKIDTDYPKIVTE